jgi:hypothetical protein
MRLVDIKERIWKKIKAVVYFTVLSKHCLQRLRKTTESLRAAGK